MNARHLDWANLSVFLVTAREGTLAAAARRLSVNASTVHRRLSNLEQQLGARLFDKSPQGYVLTAAGQDLLGHVDAIEREVLAIDRKVAGRDTSLAGTIRVATVDDLAAIILPPILFDLRAAHPGLTVEVHVESALVDLPRMQADVALRFGGRPSDPDIVARRIARVGARLFASRGYLARCGTPRVPEDLFDHTLVRGTDDMAGAPMERFMAQYARGTNSSFRTNSMLARVEAIRAGLGVGMLSPFAVPENDAELVRVEMDTPEVGAHIWIALHPDVRTNARVRTFMDFVGDRLAALEPRLCGTQ